MEKYQIIPRKFRPKRFSEVAGHDQIVTTLKNAIAYERIGQSYLFCGARGCGKTTLARIFAKALNCTNLTSDHEPCNACESCLEVSEGRSLDLIEIDGASNRGIDDIRQINETVGYAPNKGTYKIYLIDEVHMLTKEAFNALLKTLEEPPKTVKFFFATTEPHKIPQTITSRCQRFNLSRIPQEALVQKLERICKELGVECEKEALIQISLLSEGTLRDAESLLDQLICHGKTPITYSLTREVLGLTKTEHLFALDEAIHKYDQERALQLANELYLSGQDINVTIDSLLEHFRSYLMIKMGNSANPLYLEGAKNYTKEKCLSILDTLIHWQEKVQKTPFKQVHLEMLLIQLVRNGQAIGLDGLIDRLLELDSQTPKKTAEPPMEAIEPPKAIAKPVEEKIEPPKAIVDPPKEESIKEEQPTEPPSSNEIQSAKHDTLIRFAAVELEGTVN